MMDMTKWPSIYVFTVVAGLLLCQAVAGEGIRSAEDQGKVLWSTKSVYDIKKGAQQGSGSLAAQDAPAAAPSPLKGNDIDPSYAPAPSWSADAPAPTLEEADREADSPKSSASAESAPELSQSEVENDQFDADADSPSSIEQARSPSGEDPAETASVRGRKSSARRNAKTGWRLPKPRADGNAEAPEEAGGADGPSVADVDDTENSSKPTKTHQNPVDGGVGDDMGSTSETSQQGPAEDPDVSGWAVAGLDPYGNPWPVAPPFTTNKFVRPPPLADLVKIAAPRVNVAPISGGIVKTDGTHFILDGKIEYFVGTNAYYLPITDWLDEKALETFFKVSAAQGVNLTRIFLFINGNHQLQASVQPQIGVFNETGLQRFDLVFAMCAKYGMRGIMALANFEPWLGGIQWYVDQVLGSGYDKEMFYTDPRVKEAYRNYVTMILNRRNTITGKIYKNDPVVFSWELANEPHTSDGYELKRGLPPGEIVRKWSCEMSTFIKAQGALQMVSVGDEGYRVDGDTRAPHGDWLNNGWKGTSFTGNLACKDVDYGTLHIYAGNWGFPTSGADNYTWLRDNFVRDRAIAAFTIGKPYVLEEYGMAEGYLPSREPLLNFLHDAVFDYGASAVLIWQSVFWTDGQGDSGAGFNFDWTTPGNGHQAVQNAIKVMNQKARGEWKQRKDGGAYGPGSTGCVCTNTPPNNETSCEEVAKAGQCQSRLVTRQGLLRYCHASCHACPTCVDVQAPGHESTSCPAQREAGLCNENWMLGGNHCALSCNRCQCWQVTPSPPPSPSPSPSPSPTPSPSPSPSPSPTPSPSPSPSPTPSPSPSPSPTPSPGPSPSPPPPPCTNTLPPFAFLTCDQLAAYGCWYWPLSVPGTCDKSCERC